MSQTIRAHFDGRTIVPDEPLDLPAGEELEVTVFGKVTVLLGAGLETLQDPVDTAVAGSRPVVLKRAVPNFLKN